MNHVVIELSGGGTDTERTALGSLSLAGEVEILTYLGAIDFTALGNESNNTITGGVGNDTLNGGLGADSLIGGTGNDVYIVDDVLDVVLEGASAGTDIVRASAATYTLSSNVEHLIYTGSGDFVGEGNVVPQVLPAGVEHCFG